jgi:pSer/pThr/pTyr-binding forkhead associated (FHA) protein
VKPRDELPGKGLSQELDMASLCLLNDEGAMAGHWELGEHPVAVGRDESADVVIDDESLSRRHFVIVREGEHYLLKDLNSQNGTWVDGQRARATTLHHHDCIVAGRTLFLFRQAYAQAVVKP